MGFDLTGGCFKSSGGERFPFSKDFSAGSLLWAGMPANFCALASSLSSCTTLSLSLARELTTFYHFMHISSLIPSVLSVISIHITVILIQLLYE